MIWGTDRTHPGRPKSDPRPCAVYRWFAPVDQLLYIGCSVNPEQRWKTLRSTQPWTRLSDRQEVEWFPNSATAMEAEMAAIRAERPLLNLDGLLTNRRAADHWRTLMLPTGESVTMLKPTNWIKWIVGEEAILEHWAEREENARWLATRRAA